VRGVDSDGVLLTKPLEAPPLTLNGYDGAIHLHGRRMRRLGRWLLNSLTLLSLLLCVATAALWVRSYVASDRVIFNAYERDGEWVYWHQSQIYTGRGAIGFERSVQGIQPSIREQFLQRLGGRGTMHLSAPPVYPDFHAKNPPGPVLGVRFGHFTFWDEGQGHRPRATEFYVIVPLAYPFAVASGLALVGLAAWRRRRLHRRLGGCPSCSYDLTGNLSGVCPECGNLVMPPTT
jgi:hypothetical protein